MKILLVNNFFGPFGGAETVLWEEKRLLESAGHQVYCFSTDRQPYFEPEYPYSRYFPKYRDLRNHSTIRKLTSLPSSFFNPPAATCFREMLESVRPDVIHFHNLHYHLTPAILPICFDTGIPTVMTLHDTRLICPSGRFIPGMTRGERYCTSGNPIPCLSSPCKNNRSETAVSILESVFNKAHGLYRRMDGYIVPSRALGEYFETAGWPRQKIHLVENFLPGEFKLAPAPSGPGDFLLYVGRLSPEKGLDTLLGAMELCPGARLRIAGDGPERESLELLSVRLGLENRVEFLGRQPQDVVRSLYQSCLATILPCNWFEIFGLTVAESMAYGKPVIASAVGALPDLVRNGETGFLVPPADDKALASAISAIVERPESAHQMGLIAQEEAQIRFDAQRHLEALLEVYSLVSHKAPSHTS